MPYHHGFFGRPVEMFDPFSLYFPNDFPFDFPAFRPPPPPFMVPPRPLLPDMRRLMPRTNIEYKETAEAHHFKAELPGVREEDVTVNIDEGGKMIHIRAKSKHGREENKERYHHVEHGCGEFASSFTLPPDANPEHMRCCVDNGVLTIAIPKHQSYYQ
ncbi:18.1 kDa class I heat shock protein-like [Spinacia oleracea]|uniref:18.1 kDa class I heat shock protein-like n=1 Tax=Spinacia oleracea TaxID=3562 RepID=A0A9R0KAB7_SPIOL|nr:18.1 kDa class I heat shock protein-like [Spinacia oleracea]